MVLFESPHRIKDSLEDAVSVFGPERRATVSRELTKKFEETVRGSLAELLTWAEVEPRGELVLVIAGISEEEKPEATEADLLEAVDFARNSGLSLKQSVAKVALANGVSKSDLYQQVLDSRES